MTPSKITSLFLFFIFILPVVQGSASTEVVPGSEDRILQTAIDLRKGPGTFHEWSGRLFAGSEVSLHEHEAGWIRITAGEMSGWVPDYEDLFGESVPDPPAVDPDERRRAIYSLFGEDGFDAERPGGYASPTQVAAAVRGFARQYTIQRAGHAEPGVELSARSKTDPGEYRRFVEKRIGNWNRETAQGRFAIRQQDAPLAGIEQESVSWAAAGRLAGEDLIRHEEIETYLNMLGMMISESAHRYSYPLAIYLLGQETVTGYSLPAGIIFLTTGTLAQMQNEAELLFFLAHELAHIQFRHGIREMEERELQIRREEAFREMGQLLGNESADEKHQRISEELSVWADQMYEYLIRDRLDAYEYEADYWALVYLYRLGYDTGSALGLLRRILQSEVEERSASVTPTWEGPLLQLRIERMEQLFTQYPQFSEPGIVNQAPFLEQKESLLR